MEGFSMKKDEKRKEKHYPLLADYVFKQIYGSRKSARRLALLLKPLLPLHSWVRSKYLCRTIMERRQAHYLRH
jgi:hypothetical protein